MLSTVLLYFDYGSCIKSGGKMNKLSVFSSSDCVNGFLGQLLSCWTIDMTYVADVLYIGFISQKSKTWKLTLKFLHLHFLYNQSINQVKSLLFLHPCVTNIKHLLNVPFSKCNKIAWVQTSPMLGGGIQSRQFFICQRWIRELRGSIQELCTDSFGGTEMFRRENNALFIQTD